MRALLPFLICALPAIAAAYSEAGCSTADECAPSETCLLDGYCVPTPPPCTVSADCDVGVCSYLDWTWPGSGAWTAAGHCTQPEPCMADTDCGTRQACWPPAVRALICAPDDAACAAVAVGRCQAPDRVWICDTRADCRSGELCVQGRCVIERHAVAALDIELDPSRPRGRGTGCTQAPGQGVGDGLWVLLAGLALSARSRRRRPSRAST